VSIENIEFLDFSKFKKDFNCYANFKASRKLNIS